MHDGTLESLRQKWLQKSSKCSSTPNALQAEESSQAYTPTVLSVCK